MSLDFISNIEQKLSQKGYRKSKLRKALLKNMFDDQKPQSVRDILNLLLLQNLKPNKTSIYRELEILVQQNIIQEVWLKLGRFEAL